MTLLKPKVLRFDSLPSTNTELARLASEGAEEGLRSWLMSKLRAEVVFSAPGRPRNGQDSISVSLLRPKIPQDQWPLITFMAALAVGDALNESAGVKTDIKWPNDLLSGERKICGILAEGIETTYGRAVVLGIGINLTQNAFPSELANVATSVSAETGRPAEREAILAALLAAIARWYSLLTEPGGREKIVAAWSSRSSYATGKFVQVSNGDELWRGTTCGVEHDGALRLSTDSGEIKLVRAGDVFSVRSSVS